jgi:hypothetical protein
MSHYAKIVRPLSVTFDSPPKWHGTRSTLPIGTQIKRVRLGVGPAVAGVYTFEAKLDREWYAVQTDADLPAFTDKGREQRAAGSKRPTLTKGRPKGSKSSTPAPTKAGGLRMRPDQWAALDAGCKASDTTRNEVIIGALIQAGLVPQ